MNAAAEVTTCLKDGTCVRERDGREVKRWFSAPSQDSFFVKLRDANAMDIAGVKSDKLDCLNLAHFAAMQSEPLPAVPFAVKSATSQAAAVAIEPHAGALELRVLACIEAAGSFGRTCDEVEQLLNMSHQTTSARCKALLDSGRIHRTANARRTRSGRAASVLLAAGIAPELF